MKHLKRYNESWFSKSKEKDESIPNVTPSDSEEFLKLFNDIKSNFKSSNLSRYDSGMYGYYFRYKVNNEISIEVGLHSASISKNGGSFKNVNIDQATISTINKFFESKGNVSGGVGGITPDVSSSPGW